jgi:hypothetical protein
MAGLFIVRPLAKGLWTRFSTHPPIEARIQRIPDMPAASNTAPGGGAAPLCLPGGRDRGALSWQSPHPMVG